MRILALIGVLAIFIVLGAAAFFFGGFYSVAATAHGPAFVAAAFAKVRQASISHHATDVPPMSLEVQADARAFAACGCVNCHGGPGVKWAKFSEGMNPGPPDLKEVVGGLEAPELFWEVKNGIDMTGMPSFGQIRVPDQEIWSIAAFLKKLPGLSDQDYKSWTAASAGAN